jgi:peptide/nickel transport system substrate-binding protein
MNRLIASIRGRLAPALIFCASMAGLSCTPHAGGPAAAQTAVIAVAADVNAFNPLYATDVTSAEINELIYPMLVNSEFDTASGTLTYTPGLAERWEFTGGGRDLVFHLRTDASWEDGVPIRPADVQQTFALYGSPEVGSVWQDALEGLVRNRSGKLDIARAIEIVNDSTVVFHFQRPSPSHLFDAGLPIVPAHLFGRIAVSELRTHPINRAPVGARPFKLGSHTAMQDIVLVPNAGSRLPYPSRLQRLVFRIIPDYRNRVLQLRSGEVDIVAGLELDDVRRIERESPEIEVISMPPRQYHFVGWNNIDQAEWQRSRGRSIRPHALFGSAAVRRALTMAINRQDIAAALLGPFGLPAVGPVSPMFRWVFNDSLRPVPYDPRAALALLEADGWHDANRDGVLEKDGRTFSFVLNVPSGGVLWTEIATVIQQQLREVKIRVTIQQTERSVFWPSLVNKKFDAWVAGFEVPLDVRLDGMWHSDLATHPYNFLSYRNRAVDDLLKRVRFGMDRAQAAADLRQIQSIIARDQPCTFLFWERGRLGVNRRLKGMHNSTLAVTHDAWDWQVGSGR